MTVLFHGHFALNRNYMSCILNPALDQSGVKDKQLARPFGYSAPFAAHYRSWLHKTGVIELGFPVTLTAMGAVVMEHDPKFESLLTQWFLHHELVRDPERAEAWHIFANEFLPRQETFAKSELLDGLKHIALKDNSFKSMKRRIIES